MFNTAVITCPSMCGMIDDAPDVERVDLRAPRDIDIQIEHEHWQWALLMLSIVPP